MISKDEAKLFIKESLDSIGHAVLSLLERREPSTIGACVVVFGTGILIWVLL